MLSSNQTIESHSKLKELSEEGTFIFRIPLKNEALGKFSNSMRKRYLIGDGRILRQAQYERIKRVTAARRIIVDGKV